MTLRHVHQRALRTIPTFWLLTDSSAAVVTRFLVELMPFILGSSWGIKYGWIYIRGKVSSLCILSSCPMPEVLCRHV